MKPGARGTRKLLGQYGDRLVCVRYRYDEVRGRRFKTVEILLEEGDWSPPRRPFVLLELRSWETQLRERVKKAGGIWLSDQRLWRLRRDLATKLGLSPRIRPVASKKLLPAETKMSRSAETSRPPSR